MRRERDAHVVEAQMRDLAFQIDATYARDGFSLENVCLNRAFDELEITYNEAVQRSAKRRHSILQKTQSIHFSLTLPLGDVNELRRSAKRRHSILQKTQSIHFSLPLGDVNERRRSV